MKLWQLSEEEAQRQNERIAKIQEILHEDGFMMPHEIVNRVVDDYLGPNYDRHSLHDHGTVVHGFQDWVVSVTLGVGAVSPWKGIANEDTDFEDLYKPMFGVFAEELRRRGMEISGQLQEEMYETWLGD